MLDRLFESIAFLPFLGYDKKYEVIYYGKNYELYH